MLDRFLNGIADVVEALVGDETLEAIALRKTFDLTFAMFIRVSEDGSLADIQNAVRLVRDEIHPAVCHAAIEARRGWPGQARP